MKINIKDKEVELKMTFRSMLLYEMATGKSFEVPQNLNDTLTFMWCIIMASAKEMQLTRDELIDFIDEDITVVEKFSQWLVDEMTKQNDLANDKEVKAEKSKKN